MLKNHGKAFAFKPSDIGCVDPNVVTPMIIFTVPHVPWDLRPILVPRAHLPKLIELLKEKMGMKILEHSFAPYSSRWFTVPKKTGSLRFIQDMQPVNGVTIRNAGVGPIVDEFAEAFAGRAVYLMEKTMPFLDDAPIKGCREEKKDETLDSRGCRRYVNDHIADCKKILKRLEEVHLTLSGVKSTFGPLNALSRKRHKFRWEERHVEAMRRLKVLLSSSPVLERVDYNCGRPVILTVDTSPIAIGWAMGQDDENENKIAMRFGARVLSSKQREYPQVKRELWGVVNAMKAERNYLIGVVVVVETDCLPLLAGKANVVANMLSRARYDDLCEGEWLGIGCYLETLSKQEGWTDEEYRKVRKKAYFFMLEDGYL
ncbi:hypothetical protein R1sor_002177 [Riccia sorocarpa]|uniref:Reverse transcriptase/retrotransposon-derived protein RNase H-like domain-containing protein n=1 Tax=Riccia sorocarpa TaxID=122646 RepID=A0ABD3H157_9MARC